MASRMISATDGCGKMNSLMSSIFISDSISIAAEVADKAPFFSGRVIRGVRNGPSPEWLQKRLRAIGLSGHMHGATLLDASDQVLRPCILWNDGRSGPQCAELTARADFHGIAGNLVMAGFTAQEIKHKMSLRASVTSALFFDNVRVPDANRLPNVKGLKGPLGCLTQARYGITWGPIGAAIACLDEVLAYTKERILFGRPVAATQSAQIKMADMARRITAGQLLVLQLGRLKDAGEMQPQQVSLAKWNNCRMAIDIARECRDLLGGAGITTEHGAIRHALRQRCQGVR